MAIVAVAPDQALSKIAPGVAAGSSRRRQSRSSHGEEAETGASPGKHTRTPSGINFSLLIRMIPNT
jgi:hypothetical protein